VNARLLELEERRALLVARAAAQRDRLSALHQQCARPIRLAEHGLQVMRSITRSPLIVAGASAVLMRTPWKKLSRAPRWAWSAWRVAKAVRGWGN